MKKIKSSETIKIWGVPFEGINEMLRYARTGTPKHGIYVGEDSQAYPCFDSEDYACEDRRFYNLVFDRSKVKLDIKLAVLKRMKQRDCNYNKLVAALHPMIYWEGDSLHDIHMTEGSVPVKGIRYTLYDPLWKYRIRHSARRQGGGKLT